VWLELAEMITGVGAGEIPAGAVLVRAARPADRLAVAFLLASTGRGPEDASSPGRCIAVVPGPPEFVVGYGAWWPVRPGKFRIELLVAPPWRRRGAGSRLLGYVASRARDAGAVTLQARVGSEDAQSLGFLLARGFVETMRMHRQVLQVADADLSGQEHLLARLEGQGILLAPLEGELARRQDCWQEYCRLFNVVRQGWPDPDPGPGPVAALAPADFRRRYQTAEGQYRPGAAAGFLAMRADRYVGFTGALGTAVDPAFRRQGIATALKYRAVLSAREHGVTTLTGSSGNAAMLRANERLGFRLTSTEVRLVKTLGRQPSIRARQRLM
jgi:GNAT superfamily N-acetyltransferase